MKLTEIINLIYSDYRRYRAIGGKDEGSFLGVLLLTQGFWASCVYRFSHAVVCIKNSRLRRPLRIIFLFIEKWIEIITGIRIPGECSIGRGLYIGHFGHLILNDKSILGDYCNLSQGVTIGVIQTGARSGVPSIGNRVYIGPNALLFGNIKIGSDVAIGAGAVVTKSFADRSVVAGNPARLLSRDGSFELVRFDGMMADTDRMASLSLRDSSP